MSHTQDCQCPISLSYRNDILVPNTGYRSKILDYLYGRSYTLWSTTDISLRSPSWVGSCWIPGKCPHPPVQKVHSYFKVMILPGLSQVVKVAQKVSGCQIDLALQGGAGQWCHGQ